MQEKMTIYKLITNQRYRRERESKSSEPYISLLQSIEPSKFVSDRAWMSRHVNMA